MLQNLVFNKLQTMQCRSSNNVTDTDQRILCALCTVNRLAHTVIVQLKLIGKPRSSTIMVIRIEPWTPTGGGQRRRSHAPGKSKQYFSLYLGSFCYFFSIWGPFCYVVLFMGGPIYHVGAFFILFFPMRGPFLSLWGAFFKLALPSTKISAGAHGLSLDFSKQTVLAIEDEAWNDYRPPVWPKK